MMPGEHDSEAGTRPGCWTVDREGARPTGPRDEARARAGACLIVYCDTAEEAEAVWRAVMPPEGGTARRSAA